VFIKKTPLTTWPPVRFKKTHQPPATSQRGNEMADSMSATREGLSGVHSKVTIDRLERAIAVTAYCKPLHDVVERAA
jgi:hypothetical protein